MVCVDYVSTVVGSGELSFLIMASMGEGSAFGVRRLGLLGTLVVS